MVFILREKMTAIATTWYPSSNGVAFSRNYNVGRITQDGKARVTQTALVRLLNPVTITTQTPTVWTNA